MSTLFANLLQESRLSTTRFRPLQVFSGTSAPRRIGMAGGLAAYGLNLFGAPLSPAHLAVVGSYAELVTISLIIAAITGVLTTGLSALVLD